MEYPFQKIIRKPLDYSLDQNVLFDEIHDETAPSQECPRCHSKLQSLSGHSYCLGCNWDSLTSLTSKTA